MANHPNRPRRAGQPSDAAGRNPTPEEIKAARTEAGLTQAQAAALVYRSLNWWQAIEQGERRMEPALWDYFRLLAVQDAAASKLLEQLRRQQRAALKP